MFEFYPGIYPWNLAIYLALNMGGILSEIESGTRPLLKYRSAAEAGAWTDWKTAWCVIGERVQALGERDKAAGHNRTAGKKMLRASLYYLMAERMMRVGESEREPIYRRGLAAFADAMELMDTRLERVEIPYDGNFLPAYFVPARDAGTSKGPLPCVVFVNGFDVNKEILYYRGPRAELTERGISMLLVDQPGSGEALRFRNMPAIPECERWGTAIFDYLLTRSDVNPDCIGIMGVSLGGFYAPRAVAFEHRYALCVAWGASTRFGDRLVRALDEDQTAASVTDMLEQARWVFGARDNDDLVVKTRDITMVGIADKITCPFLITHGENDRQVPVVEAQEVYDDAVNSPLRELRIFTAEEGGVEHVNFDNPDIVVDFMADWIERRFVRGSA